LFTTIPPSIKAPIQVWTLKVVRVRNSMSSTPMAARGTENMTMNGSRRDS
jgi:hypothetical protein